MHFLLLTSICIGNALICLSSYGLKQRKRQCIYIGIVLFLFAALRSQYVGSDLNSYFSDFRFDASLSINELFGLSSAYTQSRDPVFHLFLLLLSRVNNNPQFMVVVIAGFEMFSLSYLLYYEEQDPFLVYMLFVCLRVYSFTLSGLRQTMAMSFVWLAYVCLKRNKIVLFFILTIIGALFHVSALVFLLSFFVIKIQNEKRVSSILIGAAVVDLVSGNRLTSIANELLFNNRFSGYIADASIEAFSASTTFILYVLIFIVFLVYKDRIYEAYEGSKNNQKIASIALMFSIIGQSFPNMFRIAYYFLIPFFGMLPQIVDVAFTERSKKIAIYGVAVLLIAQYLVLGTGAGTEEYTFFWQCLGY